MRSGQHCYVKVCFHGKTTLILRKKLVEITSKKISKHCVTLLAESVLSSFTKPENPAKVASGTKKPSTSNLLWNRTLVLFPNTQDNIFKEYRLTPLLFSLQENSPPRSNNWSCWLAGCCSLPRILLPAGAENGCHGSCIHGNHFLHHVGRGRPQLVKGGTPVSVLSYSCVCVLVCSVWGFCIPLEVNTFQLRD